MPRSARCAAGTCRRLLLLPLLAPAPALLLSILVALPTATRLVRQGGLAGALGVVLSFLAVWLVLTPVLLWVFRVVGPAAPDWLSALGVGSFTAANLSGFLHGFVLFASLPIDLGVPFGGFDEIGAGVAVLLWLYVFHVIVLAGYSATLALSRWRAARSPAAGGATSRCSPDRRKSDQGVRVGRGPPCGRRRRPVSG